LIKSIAKVDNNSGTCKTLNTFGLESEISSLGYITGDRTARFKVFIVVFDSNSSFINPFLNNGEVYRCIILSIDNN